MINTNSRYFANTNYIDTENRIFLDTWCGVNSENLASNTDVFVVMQSDSRLDRLAEKYLGNSKYWWAICMLNQMKHFWDWKVGNNIRVPTNISRFMNYISNNVNI